MAWEVTMYLGGGRVRVGLFAEDSDAACAFDLCMLTLRSSLKGVRLNFPIRCYIGQMLRVEILRQQAIEQPDLKARVFDLAHRKLALVVPSRFWFLATIFEYQLTFNCARILVIQKETPLG